MAHKVESMFSVRETPWHKLGHVPSDYKGREESKQLAGHNFTIVEKPLYAKFDELSEPIKVKGFKALFRDDNQSTMGIVGEDYNVVQNDVLWDIVDAFFENQNNVKYETAGVLDGGKVIWVLGKIDEPIVIDGDDSPVYPYILSSSSHDGSGSCRVACVSIRVVCWNTWSAAMNASSSSGLCYTFKHTKRVMDRIEEAKKALRSARNAHQTFVDLANQLAKITVNDEQIRNFTSQFIPMPDTKVEISNTVRNNIYKARDNFSHILASKTCDKIGHTGYGLWQAGIEFLDHSRTYRSNKTYFTRTMLRMEKQKEQLHNLVASVCA